MPESADPPPRALDPWLLVWAGLLLAIGLTALAYAESSAKLAAVLGPERAAINVGSAMLLAIALVLPARAATLRRFADEAATLLVLAIPLFVVARNWAALDRAATVPLLALLATQLILAGAAVAGGAGRGGRFASLYAGFLVVVIFGAPFLDYLAGEFSGPDTLNIGGISAPWAARPLLLGAADSSWRIASAANLVLAIPFAVLIRRRRSAS